MTVLAHGIGTRSDLPLPLNLVLYGAEMAMAISFPALLVLWRMPKLTDRNAGWPCPTTSRQLWSPLRCASRCAPLRWLCRSS